ncbi:MAG: glycosyltransferase family 9 protein [Candidatus Kaelpia aquatica]|nr:glycosyltransferase family 9 protein [Candidatus Kaelpia aquatica]
MKNTIAISLSGIGNTILAIPFLKNLRSTINTEIRLVLLNADLGKMLQDAELIDGYYVFTKRILANIALLLKLRKQKFDYAFTVFPSNRAGFNILTFLIAAENRVSHVFKFGFLKFDFLINNRVEVNSAIHDLEQNLNLLGALNSKRGNINYDLDLKLSGDNPDVIDRYLENKNLKNRFLVGIHPGGGGFWNKDWQGHKKRWPLERFAELSQRLIKDKDASILIFGGDEESSLKSRLADSIGDKTRVFIIDNQPLYLAALFIKHCELFISNDTGLMHLSSTLSVPTLGIFGPSNHMRTAPRGKKSSYIISKIDCAPCLKYPFYSSRSSIECLRGLDCLKSISVDDVYNKLRAEGLI